MSIRTVSLLALAALFVLGACTPKPGGPSPTVEESKKARPVVEGTWQAVYLTNGNVYYGRLKEKDDQFYVLADVHTIQVTGRQGDRKQPPRPQLIRLGNELIGLVDEISINRDHILFIQDLKNDSQVVQAIFRIKEQSQTAALPTGTLQPPAVAPPAPGAPQPPPDASQPLPAAAAPKTSPPSR